MKGSNNQKLSDQNRNFLTKKLEYILSGRKSIIELLGFITVEDPNESADPILEQAGKEWDISPELIKLAKEIKEIAKTDLNITEAWEKAKKGEITMNTVYTMTTNEAPALRTLLAEMYDILNTIKAEILDIIGWFDIKDLDVNLL